MTRLLLYTHPSGIAHDAGPGHPEAPVRLKAILKAVDEAAIPGLERREAPEASLEQIARVHPERYTSRILGSVPERGTCGSTPTPCSNPHSGEAALRAAGAACAAVDAVMAGEASQRRSAPCARPATMPRPMEAMGFCVFNNVAVGAMQARAVHKLSRLAIFDFDVHHGNGTQATFYDDPDTLYVSTHQSPLYPGTGLPRERGIKGNILNRPLPPGTGSDGLAAGGRARRAAGDRRLAAAADLRLGRLRRPRRRPAGQHGAGRGRFRLGHARAVRLADRHCDGRIVSVPGGRL